MQIPVLIERVDGNGYQARPFPFTAKGATPEEALENLRHLLQGKLGAGAKVVQLTVPEEENLRSRMAGIWKEDDPLVEEWKQIMEENRRKAEEAPDYP
jgi:hypothetical protein